jgi:uncharacterized protein (TIGR03067 family)
MVLKPLVFTSAGARMKVRFGATLVVAFLVTADLVATDPMDGTKKEKDKLKGTWVVKSFEADGKTIDSLKGMTFAFDGDKFTSKLPDQQAMPGSYKLNPSKELKELDLIVHRVGGGKTTTRAIYVFNGNELKIYAAVTTVAIVDGDLIEVIGERPKKTDGKSGATITLTRENK